MLLLDVQALFNANHTDCKSVGGKSKSGCPDLHLCSENTPIYLLDS